MYRNKHVDRIEKAKWKCGRHTVKGVRPKVLSFPTLVDITAPQTPTVESITVTVRLNSPNHTLALKLTPPVLEYLRAVVTEQLDSGDCTPIQHARTIRACDGRVVTGVKNLYTGHTCGANTVRCTNLQTQMMARSRHRRRLTPRAGRVPTSSSRQEISLPCRRAAKVRTPPTTKIPPPPPGPRISCADSGEAEEADDQMSE